MFFFRYFYGTRRHEGNAWQSKILSFLADILDNLSQHGAVGAASSMLDIPLLLSDFVHNKDELWYTAEKYDGDLDEMGIANLLTPVSRHDYAKRAYCMVSYDIAIHEIGSKSRGSP